MEIIGQLTGTTVNSLAIIGGSVLGLLVRGKVLQRCQHTVMQAVSLTIILIGLKGALGIDASLLLILSLAAGSLLGELIGIEAYLKRLGAWIEQKVSTSDQGIAKGFVNASLVFCVGAMAIVGALESGLTDTHQILFAKSILDGILAIIFASLFGIGVILSALSVFLYQGVLTLTASVMQPYLLSSVITQMSAVGGILIMAIGFNLLEITNIKVGNMLPAIFMPLLYFILTQHLSLVW